MRTALKVLGFVGVVGLFTACGSTGSSNDSGSRGATDAACQGAACRPPTEAPAPLVCGGTAAAACPQGYRCVPDPAASCPADDATCAGTCVLGEGLPGCGAEGSCPDGYVCVSNADADGTCRDGNAESCGSTCQPKAEGECTSDADCPALEARCAQCADGTLSCPVSWCDGGQCHVDFKPCVEPPPPPPPGCAAIRCRQGFHCVENATCEPDAAGVACAAACVPDEVPVQCGGITGQPCPPGLECVDAPNDTCDPASGSADCPGICEVPNGDECTMDSDCPQLRAPCTVCADGIEVCPRSFCDGGKCIVDFPTCGGAVSCGSDGCKPGTTCTDDPNDRCDPASGDCPGICVADNQPRPCRDDATCPPGYVCALDPSTGCTPDAAGVCSGACVPVPPPPPPPQCAADEDCAAIMGVCTPCPDGSYACPHAACKEGMCAVWIDACASPGFCGGIAGFPCPPGSTCIDDPTDECDPQRGGADCGGICVREDEPPACGGFLGATCPSGYDCFDDPRDDCDPTNGGADCPGVCRPAPSPKCASDADCPVIGAPCRVCADGTAACPQSSCVDGACTAEFKTCADEPDAPSENDSAR